MGVDLNGHGMIMVVTDVTDEGENLKGLIEFMDTPEVRTSKPGQWHPSPDDTRLEAVFAGPDLSETELHNLLGEIGETNPNLPIVVLNKDLIAR